MLDADANQLAAPEPEREPEQQQRAVTQTVGGRQIDAVDQFKQRVAQQRDLLCGCGSVRARDAFKDGQDARVPDRAGLALGERRQIQRAGRNRQGVASK